MNSYFIQIHIMNLFPFLLCSLYTHVIALYSNSSDTFLIKLAKGSKWRITSFENAAHRQLQTRSLSSKLSVRDDIVSECLYICNKTLTEECILIAWLFLMKIGCFGIYMKKDVITWTFLTKYLNFMMCIMFG
jgi:hypothetical protein